MSPDGERTLLAALPEACRVKVHSADHLLVKDDSGTKVDPPWVPGTLVVSSLDDERVDDILNTGIIVCVEGDSYHVLWSEESK